MRGIAHRLLSYCFMTNHIHLAIQVNQMNLSRIMQNVSFRYTRYVNWKLKRIGHLFQGRFKSVVVDSGRYLKELVRYIHLNPVRAGMVGLPEHYRWSSHNAYLGCDPITWIKPDYLLSRFDETLQTATHSFSNFVRAGIGLPEEIDFKRGSEDGILGDDDFVEKVRRTAELEPVLSVSLPELVQAVTELYGIDLTQLRAPGKERHAAHVRAVLALLVKDVEDLTLEDLGTIVQRSASGLSRQAAQTSANSLRSGILAQEITEVKGCLFEMFECQA